VARIADLEALAQRLPRGAREAFYRIFLVNTSLGRLDPPASMHVWIGKHFGSVDAVRTQKVVKVTNLVTWEGSLFNELRARRPMPDQSGQRFVERALDRSDDPFCNPLENTPADLFGRVQGRHAITASNVAKADAWHSVVIF